MTRAKPPGHGVFAEQFSLLRKADTPFLVISDPHTDSTAPMFAFGMTQSFDDWVPPHLLQTEPETYRRLAIEHVVARGRFQIFARVYSTVVPEGRDEFVELERAWPCGKALFLRAEEAGWDATRQQFPLEELTALMVAIREVRG